MSQATTHVLIAGGRKLFREGLSLLLEKEPGLRIVGEAADCDDAIKVLRAIRVQVVILNLVPAPPDPGKVVRAILRARPDVRVLVLTLLPESEYVRQLLAAGAHGCLTKDCGGPELLLAISRVMQGGIYLQPALVDHVVTRYARPVHESQPTRPLAPRERLILQMIAAGQTTKEIAAVLQVSGKTIETHRRRIMQKLNRHSVAELTKYALLEGLTSLEASL